MINFHTLVVQKEIEIIQDLQLDVKELMTDQG